MTTETQSSLYRTLDPFALAYVQCALWSSHDNADESGGCPLDDNYDESDVAEETLQRMIDDCRQFQDDNRADLAACGLSIERQGHDFWLNRNGHGSGFWDEGSEPVFRRLSEASKVWGTFDLYVGDDNQVHGR